MKVERVSLARPAAERFFDVQAITDDLIAILRGAATQNSPVPRAASHDEADAGVSAAMGT